MVAGLPNIFTVNGPGSPAVLTNMIPTIEPHVDWIADCLSHLMDRGVERIEAEVQAQEAWVVEVIEAAAKTLYPRDNSWYMGANIEGKPRMILAYMGGLDTYTQRCAEIARDGYPGFRPSSERVAACRRGLAGENTAMERQMQTTGGPNRVVAGLVRFAALAAALVIAIPLTARAPAAPNVRLSFGFGDAQIANGKAVYIRQCASCHGPNLDGPNAPALAGPRFAALWLRGDRTYGDLDHAIRAMPKSAPGRLPAQDYADLMATILAANDFPGEPAVRMADLLAAPTSRRAGRGSVSPPLTRPTSLPAPPASVTAAQTSAPNDADLLHPVDSDWLMFNRTYSGGRFSPLAQINVTNVTSLQPACILSLGVLGSFQGSPIIYKGTGFIGSANGVFAFDAATCERKWSYSYSPKGPEGIQTSRGVMVYDGKVFRGTSDGHLIALDMVDGKLLWDAHVADGAAGHSIGAAPVAFEGKVIVGLAGGDFGNTGHVYAFDARTGNRVWTFDTIDAKSWPKGAESGGGASWTSVAVDPEKRLIYIPVGNPAPDELLEARPGANLYTNSVVAVDADTGKVAWYVQQLGQDYHDWDTAAAPILYEQDGRRFMAVGTKAGYVYIYDRDSHLLVSRTNVVPRLNDTLPLTDKPLRVCPGTMSGVEWNGPAYDPGSKSLYVNSVHWCSIYTLKPPEGKIPGSWYLEADVTMDPIELSAGWTRSLDAASGKERWAREAPRPMIGAVTATAGGIVLSGGGDGMFLALDQRDGRELYRFNTGGGIGGGVATYMVGGRQYVAVASGGFGLLPFGVTGAPAVVVFALPVGAN